MQDSLSNDDGQVDNGDIWGGHAEGHSGQFAAQARDDLANGLGCSGGGGNDVLSGSAAASPVLVGRSINLESVSRILTIKCQIIVDNRSIWKAIASLSLSLLLSS